MSIIKSEIRKSYLSNQYVIITPGRAKRPRDIKEQTIIQRTGSCPFCPGKINEEKAADKIKKDGKWKEQSVKNIFPAVSEDNDKANGTQEVIIETRNHTLELADLPENEIELVLRMYAKRTKSIGEDKNIDYILCFKNQGSKAGASIVHAHSQVFATKILPPDLIEEQKQVQDHWVQHKECPYCKIIEKEMKSERRIYEDKNFAVFAPYASQYHYESWFFPKRHLDNITELDDQELVSLAKALKMVLVKMKALDLSFNLFLHNVISNQKQHFYIKVQPRDSIWAGVELGAGLIINSVPPEIAAEYFRK